MPSLKRDKFSCSEYHLLAVWKSSFFLKWTPNYWDFKKAEFLLMIFKSYENNPCGWNLFTQMITTCFSFIYLLFGWWVKEEESERFR